MNKRKITFKKRVKRDMAFYIRQYFHTKTAKRIRYYMRKVYKTYGINVY